MARKRQSKNGNYGIGKNRPPVYSQFKPKQSGNPGGRPKKKPEAPPMPPTDSELDALLRAELDRVITINEGGKPKKMKASKLVSRSQINSAIKGNSNAQHHVMRQMRELEKREAERAKILAEQQEAEREQQLKVYEFMVLAKGERARIWAEAAARGCEPDQPWPHPDDILLFPELKRWHVRGPYDGEGVPFYSWSRAERDYLLAYAVASGRSTKKSTRALEGIFTTLWVSYDVKLPLRWQIAPRLDHALAELHFMPIKKLRALVDDRRDHSEHLKVIAGIPDGKDKETYKFVNTIMKPLLNQQGYRSLAEFEHAYDAHGPDMAWPKRQDAIRSG